MRQGSIFINLKTNSEVEILIVLGKRLNESNNN